MVRITDKNFVYTPSYDTDLSKKFRAIIEQQRKAAPKQPKIDPSVKSQYIAGASLRPIA